MMLLLLVLLSGSDTVASLLDYPSLIETTRGHYPPRYVSITNAILQASDGIFYYNTGKPDTLDLGFVRGMWDLRNDKASEAMECHETFDIGHVFPLYYYYGSNYFHLHVDTMLPLYKARYSGTTSGSYVYMPSVESTRLKKLDWNTEAFQNRSKYWVEILRVFISGEHKLLPLDQDFRNMGKNICFKTLHFGTPCEPITVVSTFADFAKARLGIHERKFTGHRVGIISRNKRQFRQILNENELVNATQHFVPTDLLTFEGMTYRGQVELMQDYTVLVGMNGAGLSNGYYLRSFGVNIQLAPFQPYNYNIKEYGELLAARGPYLMWENKNESRHDANGNTEVDVKEFIQLVKEAIALSNSKMKLHQEL